MKKLGVIFAVIAIISLAGCASGGGGGGGGKAAAGGGDAFIVDLSKLGGKVDTSKLSAGERSGNTFPDTKQVTEGGKVVGIINATPLEKAWSNVLIELPASALPSDLSQYTRLTITAKYYSASNEEIAQSDSNVMVSMIINLSGDIRGPAQGPGANTPIKEFNVGGFSGMIDKDRGVRVSFKEAPQAVLLQNNSGSAVAFISLTGLIFHNGDYKSK